MNPFDHLFFILGMGLILAVVLLVRALLALRSRAMIEDDLVPGRRLDRVLPAREHDTLPAAREAAELRAELAMVKQRVATLERIVTEPGTRLAAEIETLRDDRENAQ